MNRAKELFLKYSGNRFYMDREGDGAEYDRYHVPKETEEMWAEEYISAFLLSEMNGRDAIRAYSTAAELLNRFVPDERWTGCLYYPLRAEHLDDATALYMLQTSFRMADRAAKKHRFSKEDRDTYVRELNEYIHSIKTRIEAGTMTRSTDYMPQEFSDPVYTADYLNSIAEKWNGLFH